MFWGRWPERGSIVTTATAGPSLELGGCVCRKAAAAALSKIATAPGAGTSPVRSCSRSCVCVPHGTFQSCWRRLVSTVTPDPSRERPGPAISRRLGVGVGMRRGKQEVSE